jgi:hypothetical protein
MMIPAIWKVDPVVLSEHLAALTDCRAFNEPIWIEHALRRTKGEHKKYGDNQELPDVFPVVHRHRR